LYQSVQGGKPKFQLGRKVADDPVARAGRVRLTDVLALLYEACATEQRVTSHETAAVPSAHQVLDNRESIAFLLNDRFAPTTRMLLSLRLHGY
jgi:hypothetical protein